MISTLLRAATLSIAMLVAACAPREIGSANAPAYFAEHRAEFERLIEQVDLCQPDSGRLDPNSDFRCWSSGGNPQNVRNAMREVGAQWIRTYYNGREGEERQIASVTVAMPSTYGFSFAGVIEAFIYEAEPADHAAYERTDQGAATIEQLPVTDAPHHWYWWKVER